VVPYVSLPYNGVKKNREGMAINKVRVTNDQKNPTIPARYGVPHL
jgi:hypothetical protein